MIKTVTMYRTDDGQLFEDPEKAHKHSDEVYGAMLLGIAKDIVQTADNYMKCSSYLDSNIDTFRELVRLSDAREFAPEDK